MTNVWAEDRPANEFAMSAFSLSVVPSGMRVLPRPGKLSVLDIVYFVRVGTFRGAVLHFSLVNGSQDVENGLYCTSRVTHPHVHPETGNICIADASLEQILVYLQALFAVSAADLAAVPRDDRVLNTDAYEMLQSDCATFTENAAAQSRYSSAAPDHTAIPLGTGRAFCFTPIPDEENVLEDMKNDLFSAHRACKQ